jgi:hypothetical protein
MTGSKGFPGEDDGIANALTGESKKMTGGAGLEKNLKTEQRGLGVHPTIRFDAEITLFGDGSVFRH